MIPLDDARWKEFEAGYRIPYDASVPLRALRDSGNSKVIWDELWGDLHHQGDVGIASYAAVPHLVSICAGWQTRDWNLHALASTIELARGVGSNPNLPEWLEESYSSAWSILFDLACVDLKASEDIYVTRSTLGVMALHRGDSKMGRILSSLDSSDVDEIYAEYFNGGEDDAPKP